jgi:enolase-phosphatase E1
MKVTAHGILLDVEGTTSSVAFVYDVMFPYARQHMEGYISEHWQDDTLRSAARLIARESNSDAAAKSPAALITAALWLMDDDVKSTGLKELQGLVWEDGFRSGKLVAHVYDDVPSCLKNWRDAGLSLRIYSSGSIHAQRLFFGHSVAGDLLSLLDGHYDTTTGAKREAESYRKIAADWQLPANQVLFLSDVPDELFAAREAGMQVALVERPGNAPVPQDVDLPRIKTFSDLVIQSAAS